MAGLKKLVGVTVAAVVIAALVVYVLRPAATPDTSSAVVNVPGGNPRTGDGNGHHGGTGTTPVVQPPTDDHGNCTDHDHGHDNDTGEHSDHDNHDGGESDSHAGTDHHDGGSSGDEPGDHSGGQHGDDGGDD